MTLHRTGAAPQVAGHQDALDGVRAVAAFGVLLFHVAGAAGVIGGTFPAGGWVFNGGQVGVPIFFVLSGLLLYRPWARALLTGTPRPDARTYLRRRALRILPAYWALVTVVMLTGERDSLGNLRAWTELLSLTYVYDPGSGWSALGPRQMGQTWSLCVEVAFYLALPAVAAGLAWWARRVPDTDGRARRLLYGLGGLATVSFAHTVLMFVPAAHPRMGAWLPRHLAWFAIGMALSVLVVWARENEQVARSCRAVAQSWDLCWAVGALLVVVVASPVTGMHDLVSPDTLWTSSLNVLFGGLAALFLVAPVALAPQGSDGPMQAMLGNRAMRLLGRISYSVFLWQSVVILGWFDVTGRLYRGSLLIDLPVTAIATTAVALLSYHLVERPALRRR